MLILAAYHGLTRESARMTGTAIDHVGGAPAGSQDASGLPLPLLDAGRLADAMRDQLLHAGRVVVRIPGSEWKMTRDALLQRAEQPSSAAVRLVFVAASRATGTSMHALFARALTEQTGAPEVLPGTAGAAASLQGFARQNAIRRIVFVLEEQEQLPADERLALAACFRAICEMSGDYLSCTLLVLEMLGKQSAPDFVQAGKCRFFDCHAFRFPDPLRVPYYYDR